jgi:HAD superfamily hydrolase (TIGR01490 family)
VSSPAREIAFFDLDKTVITKSSTLAFGRPFYKGGLVNRRAVYKSVLAQLVYRLRGADADSMDRVRDQLRELCAGWPVEQVNAIVTERMHLHIGSVVYVEALELFDEHRAAGREVVIVSSSSEHVVRPIGELLDVDHVIATRMAVVDGKYTGEIDFYVHGESKAEAMREFAAERGYDLEQCWAYGDSATDQAMLRAVGHPMAVNPDKQLRQLAEDNGWPVRDFQKKVRVRPWHRPHPGKAAAYAVVGLAALGSVLAWQKRRQRA